MIWVMVWWKGFTPLYDYRGQRVLLVFSDPNCGPYTQLAPEFERLQRSSSDLQVLRVSCGDPELNHRKVSEHQLPFPVVLQYRREISRKYGDVAVGHIGFPPPSNPLDFSGFGSPGGTPKGKLHISSDGNWSHPQLCIEQTDQNEWARIRLNRADKQTGNQVGKYWDIAVGGSEGSEVMNFCPEGRGAVMTLDQDGTLTVSNDIVLTNADCAEEFEVAEAAETEPGTVMVLDHDGVLRQSAFAYDKRVAGVISGGGDYQPGIILDKQQALPNRKPVALVGKVYCKVDAEYAPIEVGDLLTTSSRCGHAMKATDRDRAFGAVIGKALSSLDQGCGLIPILVALQ